jgi:nitrate reductase gamma subunit
MIPDILLHDMNIDAVALVPGHPRGTAIVVLLVVVLVVRLQDITDVIETTEATMGIAEIALLLLLARIEIGLAMMIATSPLSSRLTAITVQFQACHHRHLPASSSRGCELI